MKFLIFELLLYMAQQLTSTDHKKFLWLMELVPIQAFYPQIEDFRHRLEHPHPIEKARERPKSCHDANRM